MGWSGNGIRRPGRGGDRRAPSPAPTKPVPARHAGRRDTRAGEDPWMTLARELDRSRRYSHPLTLVRIVPAELSGHRSLAARARREGRPGRRRGDRFAAAVAGMRRAVRSGDCAWADDGAVYLMLLETDARGAETMVARVLAAGTVVAPDSDVRIASFPEHVLTAHALRAAVAEPRVRPAATPLGDLEWRTLADRINPSSHAPGAVPEGAD